MRYKVINESISAHCCFVATVVDTQEPCPAPLPRQTVCKCFSSGATEKVARALNAEEENMHEGEVSACAAAAQLEDKCPCSSYRCKQQIEGCGVISGTRAKE